MEMNKKDFTKMMVTVMSDKDCRKEIMASMIDVIIADPRQFGKDIGEISNRVIDCLSDPGETIEIVSKIVDGFTETVDIEKGIELVDVWSLTRPTVKMKLRVMGIGAKFIAIFNGLKEKAEEINASMGLKKYPERIEYPKSPSNVYRHNCSSDEEYAEKSAKFDEEKKAYDLKLKEYEDRGKIVDSIREENEKIEKTYLVGWLSSLSF